MFIYNHYNQQTKWHGWAQVTGWRTGFYLHLENWQNKHTFKQTPKYPLQVDDREWLLCSRKHHISSQPPHNRRARVCACARVRACVLLLSQAIWPRGGCGCVWGGCVSKSHYAITMRYFSDFSFTQIAGGWVTGRHYQSDGEPLLELGGVRHGQFGRLVSRPEVCELRVHALCVAHVFVSLLDDEEDEDEDEGDDGSPRKCPGCFFFFSFFNQNESWWRTIQYPRMRRSRFLFCPS